jgi:DNA mismatch endonuclease, patch repair protein
LADVLTPEQRRLNMSRIRGKNTKPELVLRRGLHARGLRFRLHCKELPGAPDLVFPKWRALILIHGCFWHGHDCPMFKRPGTRANFWNAKIARNQERDRAAAASLRAAGWRVLVVWECALRGPARRSLDEVTSRCTDFLKDQGQEEGAIGGRWETARF